MGPVTHFWHLVFFFRLLDVIPGRRNQTEMTLSLVFEHVDQDLARYLDKVPSPGLGPDRIRVGLPLV